MPAINRRNADCISENAVSRPSHVDGLEMSLPAPNDHEILQHVTFQLKRHRSATRLVSANVVRGIVVLSGQVVSFHHRQICISAAQQVEGVVRIDDQLDVIAAPQQENSKRSIGIKNDRRAVKK